MPNLTVICRNATVFTKTNELDEDAFRQFLQRFVDAKLGVYLASGGSGEGHTLAWDELRRVYEIGVEVCKGKVPVNANPPEKHTAKETIDHANLAIEAGVDVVNVYGPAMLHGFKPTDDELIAYHDEILKAIRHPVALAPNPVIGYTPSPTLMASISDRYSQVVAINLSGLGNPYFIDLKNSLKRDVDIYHPVPGSLHALGLGATGLLSAEANIIPKTLRRYIDLYESGDFETLGTVYEDFHRFNRFVAKWHSGSPRWLKMALRILKLPGGEGGVRLPYLMPSDDEVDQFAEGLLRLRVPEIDEMAKVAGLSIPS